MSSSLILLFLLFILSAFFSAAETAFTSLNIMQLKEMHDKKTFRGKIVWKVAKKPELFLGTILFGNNVVNIFSASIVTAIIIELYGEQYLSLGSLVVTFIILIFCEVTPKQIALVHNEFIAKNTAIPVYVLSYILSPVTIVIITISNLATKLTSGKKKKNVSLEGIIHMVNLAEDDGLVPEYETDMVKKVFRLNHIPVSSIMTHRTDVFSLPFDMSVAEAKKVLETTTFSRIPIYKDNLETILGIALARDIFLENESKLLKDIAIKPIFVSEGKKANDLFGLFKIRRDKMAIVLDEYGGLAGIVTQEDVIEEIFGELYDEADNRKEDVITQLNFNTYLLRGELSCDEFAQEFGASEIKHTRFSFTIGGYIAEILDRLPKDGDSIFISTGKLIVQHMDKNKVETILYKEANKKDD